MSRNRPYSCSLNSRLAIEEALKQRQIESVIEQERESVKKKIQQVLFSSLRASHGFFFSDYFRPKEGLPSSDDIYPNGHKEIPRKRLKEIYWRERVRIERNYFHGFR